MSELQGATSEIEFVLNGIRVRLADPDPSELLVDYLRSSDVGLTGTKLVCGEGGCGSCTVSLAHLDRRTGTVVERPVNSCLRPLCTLDGTIVTTTEGLGRTRTGLNPIQERIADYNGSQCGYCTPGWVMTMYGLLRNNQAPDAQEVEDQFAGNLCRCTGMRPILNAMQSFVGDAPASKRAAGTLFDARDFPAPRRLHLSGAHQEYYRPLELREVLDLLKRHRATQDTVKLLNGNTSVAIYKRDVYDPAVLIDISQIEELTGVAVEGAGIAVGGGVTLTSLRAFLAEVVAREDPAKTAGLAALASHLTRVAGEQVRAVGTVAGNLMLAKNHEASGDPFPSDLMTVLGALDAGVAVLTPGAPEAEQVYPLLDLPDPATFPDGLLLTRVTIPFTSAESIVQTYKVARREQNAHALVNAGFSLDFTGAAEVTRARLVFGGIARIAVRAAATEAFLTGKPWTRATFEAARTVLAGELQGLIAPMPADGVSDQYRADLALSLFYKYFVHVAGAIAPGEVTPDEASAGQRFVRAISSGEHRFVEAPYVEGEPLEPRISVLSMSPGTPRYAAARQESAVQMLSAQGASVDLASPDVPTADHVIAVNTPDPPPPSEGHPMIKTSARTQATGEAKFTQDTPAPPGMLEAAYVYSRESNALFSYGSRTIEDVVAHLRAIHKGFVAYVSAADVLVKGSSDEYQPANPSNYDPIFADGRVTAYGQPIGMVLADTLHEAQRAADDVHDLIVYDTDGLTPVYTIDASRALPNNAGVMYKGGSLKQIKRPGSDDAWLASPGPEPGKVYVSGTQRTGAQAHFYFETQAAVAMPDDSGGMLLYSSSQHLSTVQGSVAGALGLPMSKVQVRASRLGGGYGGKEVRPPYFAAAAAVAAWKVSRPVRLALDRNTDMLMVGKRHPFEGTYHVLADESGRIEKFRVDFASDGGSSYDCSLPVMDLVLLSADNAYNIPTFQANGTVYRTNRATNTAFRSFGVIQCTLVVEEAIERLAHELGMDPEAVRRANFYRDATLESFDVTPYGQPLRYARINQVWGDLMEMADLRSRLDELHAFNAANRWRKRGMSLIPIKYGISYTYLPMNQATAEIVVYTDGSVLVHHGGIEMGQGVDTKILQIAADALRIDINRVQIAYADTASVANASSTGASTGTDLQGGAVLAAAKELRERLVKFCRETPPPHAPHWETDWAGSWEAIVSAAFGARVNLSVEASYKSPDLAPLDANGQLPEGGQMFYYFTYSAGASEVEIDVLTGEVAVLRSDLIYDAGQTVNSELDYGQVEGGFVQGLGNVTTEQLYYRDDGRLIPYGTWNYKPPCSKTIPVRLNVGLLEYVRSDIADGTPIDRYGIMSSKSTGEPPLVLASSVFFAIKHAVVAAREAAGLPGWVELDSPATVERVRQACSAP
jgi:xanthine dehydrogenase/oxidase